MSTEYYRVQECNSCGHEIKRLIGVSAVGYAFQLRTYESFGIKSLQDWEYFLRHKIKNNNLSIYIKDEYGKRYTVNELIEIIHDDQKKYVNSLKHSNSLYEKHFDTYDLVKGE